MDPNSRNQWWSFWEYHVYPAWNHRPTFAMVKANCSRFGRTIFGSASQMHIRVATDAERRLFWEIKVLSEGHPVHDPQYTEWVHAEWRRFFREGFGQSCEVRVHARLAAGDRQDGTPADQLIVVPGIPIHEEI